MQHRFSVRKAQVLACAFTLAAVAACSAPGEDTSTSSQDPDREVGVELTDEDVTIDLYLETGFPLVEELSKEFTKQHPNITFDIRTDQFAVITENAPRVLAGDDAPDLIRSPSISALAADGLLLDLDPYGEAFSWDQFPPSQLEQMRVDEDGSRGSGGLYAMGAGYNLTGVFYNTEKAAALGMEEPPATLEEFETLLADAKAAGEQPIMQFNDIGGINFPYQAVLNQLADPADISDWIFQKPGASIDTPEAAEAASYIARWADEGYFPEDANALDYTGMMGRFGEGDGVFMFNGDWESGNLEKTMGEDVGFFLMPPAEEGGEFVAMGAPGTYAVPAKAEHPDEIAYFINWWHTDPAAREIIVNTGGTLPGGPADLPVPEVEETSLIHDTLAAGETLASEGVLVDFTANATPGIYANVIRPELQALVEGRLAAEEFPSKLQSAYEEELGS